MMILENDKPMDIERVKLIVDIIKKAYTKQHIRSLISNFHLIGEQEEDYEDANFNYDIEELLAALFPEADYFPVENNGRSREWRNKKVYINDDIVKMQTKLNQVEYCGNNKYFGLLMHDDVSETQIELFIDDYRKVTGIRWKPDIINDVEEVLNKIPTNTPRMIVYPCENFKDAPSEIRDALDYALDVARNMKYKKRGELTI